MTLTQFLTTHPPPPPYPYQFGDKLRGISYFQALVEALCILPCLLIGSDENHSLIAGGYYDTVHEKHFVLWVTSILVISLVFCVLFIVFISGHCLFLSWH